VTQATARRLLMRRRLLQLAWGEIMTRLTHRGGPSGRASRHAVLAVFAGLGLAACNTVAPSVVDNASTDARAGSDGGDASPPRDSSVDVDAGSLADAFLVELDGALSDAGVDAALDDASGPGIDAWSAELDASGPDAWSADPDDASAPPIDGGTDAFVAPPVCPFASDLQASADAELARQGITGVALGIDMPGCLWRSASGIEDRSTGRAMLASDRFRIASITKTFTAAVVLQLVDEGRLHLTDTLSTFVAFPGGDAITIRQLLAHTSGIYDYFNSPPVEAAYGRVWTREEVIDVARAQPPVFAPGSNWGYSNTNYFLLGMIIEAVTGNPYHHEVRTRLLEPLGLDDTYVAGPESLPGGVAHGYERVSAFVDRTDLVDPSLTWAAGGIVSNVEDLDGWARALFTGDVLSVATRTAMLTPEPLPGGRTAPTGLGVWIDNLPRGLGRYYSHIGRVPGYYTMFGYLADHDAVMVELTDDTDGAPNPFMTDMWSVVGLL
jgi:D-alanyl-D-alanine carboxypeptidase